MTRQPLLENKMTHAHYTHDAGPSGGSLHQQAVQQRALQQRLPPPQMSGIAVGCPQNLINPANKLQKVVCMVKGTIL
jgi:hypothetical protein